MTAPSFTRTAIWLSSLLLQVSVSMLPPPAHAGEPASARASFLKKAVFAEGRLWLLDDGAALSSTAPNDHGRTPEPTPGPVQDLCVGPRGQLLVVTRETRGRKLALREHSPPQWSLIADLPGQAEAVLGLSCGGSEPVLLTSKRLVTFARGRIESTPLPASLFGGRIGGVTSVAASSEALLVGINAGEWGGGLLRVDRRTGEVSPIERNETGDLCGGPLNTGCDPVNGVEAEPWKQGCALVAIGLVHFTPHGRLVEVCDRKIEPVFYAPFGSQPPKELKPGHEPFSTVAFFGLQRQGDALWAVGIDGLYRVTQRGVDPPKPLPQFVDRDGVSLSFDIPHLIVVLTMVNQRRSISGATPLLVAY